MVVVFRYHSNKKNNGNTVLIYVVKNMGFFSLVIDLIKPENIDENYINCIGINKCLLFYFLHILIFFYTK